MLLGHYYNNINIFLTVIKDITMVLVHIIMFVLIVFNEERKRALLDHTTYEQSPKIGNHVFVTVINPR